MVKGSHHSQEAKLKLSISHKGMKKPWVAKANLSHIPTTKGLKFSDETRRKMAQYTGASRYNYISDRTKLKRHNRKNDMAYKEWRKNVWGRDGFKCQTPNENCAGCIEAHHILRWGDYPDLRYDISNGLTLCHFHHPRKGVDEKKLTPLFQSIVEKANQFA